MGDTLPSHLTIQTKRDFDAKNNMGPGFLVLLLLSVVYKVSSNQISTCITNCGQCKRMLGPYFKGQACAESCLATNGLLFPDCNNPHTLRAFLKRLY